MTIWAVVLLVATTAYLGFQLTVRLVVYPQLAGVPADGFVAFERRHQGLISRLVGPLFVADGVGCVGAFAAGPRVPAAVAGGALIGILVVTALAAVPLHRRLSAGFDRPAWRRLLAVDSVRLGLAVVGVAAAVWFAVG